MRLHRVVGVQLRVSSRRNVDPGANLGRVQGAAVYTGS
jgi:hypothetical protein